MVKGLGLDLCEISRMDKLLENDRFLNRYYTEEEKTYIRSKGINAAQTAAGIFAAKEDRFELSVSHDGGIAAAVCVREAEQ